jgi:hypothetical protein
MRFDTKIVVAVRDDLKTWQKLNVTAFLAGGIAGVNAGTIGEPYADGSGTRYGALIRQPILIFAGDLAALRRAHTRGLDRDVRLHVYISAMFETGHDEANRATVAASQRDALDLVGIGFIADRKIADKVTDGLKLRP